MIEAEFEGIFESALALCLDTSSCHFVTPFPSTISLPQFAGASLNCTLFPSPYNPYGMTTAAR